MSSQCKHKSNNIKVKAVNIMSITPKLLINNKVYKILVFIQGTYVPGLFSIYIAQL